MPVRMTEQNPIPQRPGPRPLPFHLMTQASSLLSSHLALSLWKSGSPSLSARLGLPDAGLLEQLAALDQNKLHAALTEEAGRRVACFVKAVSAYRAHPYRRTQQEYPVIWQQGSTRLLDYAPSCADGIAVLVVPSLINRAYILDLTERRSLLRAMARKGLRPFLVDWGAPGEQEANFGLEDYIATRLSAMLDTVIARAGRPVMLGYCMGGLLGLALASLRQQDLLGQILLATPWDFHRPQPRRMDLLRPLLRDLVLYEQPFPPDLLQILFSLQDPFAIERKYRHFARLKPTSAAARNFVALEDWVNDCVPLTAKVAEQTLEGWYGENRPIRRLWRVAGETIRPERIYLPSLLMIPMKDRIVPKQQALALAESLPHCAICPVEGGHVGMMLGARAGSEIYDVIVKSVKRMGRRRRAGNISL